MLQPTTTKMRPLDGRWFVAERLRLGPGSSRFLLVAGPYDTTAGAMLDNFSRAGDKDVWIVPNDIDIQLYLYPIQAA